MLRRIENSVNIKMHLITVYLLGALEFLSAPSFDGLRGFLQTLI